LERNTNPSGLRIPQDNRYVYKGAIKLNLKWIYESNNVNWDELSILYKIAPLGDKKPNDLRTVFLNSMFKCFVYADETLIGVGRALADGIDCSYICDVAIHPNYQGQGIGKEIVNKLIELSKGHNKIILYSYPGKERFYSKLGFDMMNTAMAIFKNKEQAREWQLTRET
jgi:GNAT superfamily N-acetyltransferase